MTQANDQAAELRAQRSARHAGLLERARTGDQDALGTMVAELTPLLWHVARGQGLSAAAPVANDVPLHTANPAEKSSRSRPCR